MHICGEQKKQLNSRQEKEEKNAVQTPGFSARLETRRKRGRRWNKRCFGVFFPSWFKHHVVLTNYYFLCCVKNKKSP